jgi:uncharacterized small protein (DUF1192 family)
VADKMTVKQALKAIQTEVNYHAGSDTHYRVERLEQSLATLRAEIKRLEKDAGRYRWLRRKVCIAGGEFHVLNLDPRYIAPNAAVELDAAIDKARGEGVGK